MITEAIGVAIITGGLAVLSNVLIAAINNGKTMYRIALLENKVEKHNNLVERMVIVEESEKTQWHQIDDIKDTMEKIREKIR